MSAKTERRRHERLALATASWRSWAVNNWFTNGYMAVELTEPFSVRPMSLTYDCLCGTFDKHEHRHTLDRLCVFAAEYEPDETMAERLSKTLVRIVGDRKYARLDIEDSCIVESSNEPGLEMYRARINDDPAERAWVGVNKRFVDLIRDETHADRWFLSGLRGVKVGDAISGSQLPSVLAMRGDRLVGSVMPIACNDSAVGFATEVAP